MIIVCPRVTYKYISNLCQDAIPQDKLFLALKFSYKLQAILWSKANSSGYSLKPTPNLLIDKNNLHSS